MVVEKQKKIIMQPEQETNDKREPTSIGLTEVNTDERFTPEELVRLMSQVDRLSPLVSAVIGRPDSADINTMVDTLSAIITLHKESVLLTYQSVMGKPPSKASDLAAFVEPVSAMLTELWKKSIDTKGIRPANISNFIGILCSYHAESIKNESTETNTWEEHDHDTLSANIEIQLLYSSAISQLMSVPLEIGTFNQARKRLFISELSMDEFMSAIKAMFEQNSLEISTKLAETFDVKDAEGQLLILKKTIGILSFIYKDAFHAEFFRMKIEFKNMSNDGRKAYQEKLPDYEQGVLMSRVSEIIAQVVLLLYPDISINIDQAPNSAAI